MHVCATICRGKSSIIRLDSLSSGGNVNGSDQSCSGSLLNKGKFIRKQFEKRSTFSLEPAYPLYLPN